MNQWRNIVKEIAIVETCPKVKVPFIGSGTATTDSKTGYILQKKNHGIVLNRNDYIYKLSNRSIDKNISFTTDIFNTSLFLLDLKILTKKCPQKNCLVSFVITNLLLV
jgi:hypothetical protein